MPYIIQSDYKKAIQADNLSQIIGSDLTILADAQETATQEAISKIRQKYDIAREMTNTFKWDAGVIYKAAERIYFTAPAFSATTAYNTNDLVAYTGIIYKSKAGSVAHAFNPTEWDALVADNTLFFVTDPFPYFDVYALYQIGDSIIYKGKTYTCITPSNTPNFPPDPSYVYYEAVPAPNVFPDAPNGVYFWGVGVPYVVAAGTLPTDATKWTQGDNRDKLLVMYIVDITLYHVHKRISPRNIPDIRVKAYDDAISALKKDFAEGAATPIMPVKQPRQGGRIRFGGNIKNTNSY